MGTEAQDTIAPPVFAATHAEIAVPFSKILGVPKYVIAGATACTVILIVALESPPEFVAVIS